jgi:hypothetical protein
MVTLWVHCDVLMAFCTDESVVVADLLRVTVMVLVHFELVAVAELLRVRVMFWVH